MEKKPLSSRIRKAAVPAVFFLLGAYPLGVSLWWASLEPALYATQELTSWAMFKVIFGYISAIVLGGMLGLGVLRLIRIGRQKALQRWPQLQKTPMVLSSKQRLVRSVGFALACILALGVGGFAFWLQTFVWVAIPGASIRVNNRPSPASGVYTTWTGQMLVVVSSKDGPDYCIIDPIGTREDAPAMCDQGYPREALLLRTHLIQVEINDLDDEMGCEVMPGLEVLVDPELRLQSYKMTFTSPDNQHVEITFWHF